mmetsp:Transcript_14086/g.21397  ORF Transcript_14086/g.21397 Transcript_14086/m.21397 type:complete len:84 (-) Transcript_14086:17-268(-)
MDRKHTVFLQCVCVRVCLCVPLCALPTYQTTENKKIHTDGEGSFKQIGPNVWAFLNASKYRGHDHPITDRGRLISLLHDVYQR